MAVDRCCYGGPARDCGRPCWLRALKARFGPVRAWRIYGGLEPEPTGHHPVPVLVPVLVLDSTETITASMNFWTTWAINTALALINALLTKASTTPEHAQKTQAFVLSGHDLTNKW